MAPKIADSKPAQLLKKVVAVPDTTISQAAQAGIRKFLIIMIVGTSLVVLIGGYFIWALAKKNILVSNQVKAQGIYIKLAEDKIDVLNKSESKLTELKAPQSNGVSDFELVTQRALPESDDLSMLLTIFQKLEAGTLVKLENVSKQTKTQAAQVQGSTTTATGAAQSFTINFKATGTYEQIQKFLKGIESSTRVFDFSTLKIAGSAQQTSLDMSYRMYYLPKPSIVDKQVPLDEYTKEGK